MNRRFSLSLVAAVAICAGSVFFTARPAAANCGFVGCVFHAVGLGGVGDALDDANRSVRERSSDASVYNQLTGNWNTPFQAAGGGQPAPAMGNMCVIPDGRGFAGPPNPRGTPCIVQFNDHEPVQGTVM